MNVNRQQLLYIAPHAGARVSNVLPHLNECAKQYEINTPLRMAHFLAQVCHESGEFSYVKELASGMAYEGRKDLGNVYAGDGPLYKGRGYMQLTGRNNYTRYEKESGNAVVKNPKLLESPKLAMDSACWFWKTHGLNELADKDNLTLVTKRVNGGLNGFKEREKYLLRAKKALGI